MRLDLADCIEFENILREKSSGVKFEIRRLQQFVGIRHFDK